MAQIISIHSFRGGTGKSNVTANLATLLAHRGRRVGIIDTDIQSPGIHVIFGLDESRVAHSLNDYLWSRCEIEDAAYEVAANGPKGVVFAVYLIPAALQTGEITRILREGYDVVRLNDGFRDLVHELNLDYLFIDTHPGLNEETLLSIAVSDFLFILLRPDQQDYLGTAVAVEVARRLEVPSLHLIVNKVPSVLDSEEVRSQVAATFECDVAAVLPLCEEMISLGSSGLFVEQYPDHVLTKRLGAVAEMLAS